MKRGSKKSPIQPRTKEQILAEMTKNADFQQRMRFVKDKFWPALCAASQNIEDATMLLTGFNNIIMETFLGQMKEKKLSDLNLKEKLDKASPKYAENIKLLELFEGFDVFRAKELIEGMKGEVQIFVNDELKDRPLSTLKTKWIDE